MARFKGWLCVVAVHLWPTSKGSYVLWLYTAAGPTRADVQGLPEMLEADQQAPVPAQLAPPLLRLQRAVPLPTLHPAILCLRERRAR